MISCKLLLAPKLGQIWYPSSGGRVLSLSFSDRPGELVGSQLANEKSVSIWHGRQRREGRKAVQARPNETKAKWGAKAAGRQAGNRHPSPPEIMMMHWKVCRDALEGGSRVL